MSINNIHTKLATSLGQDLCKHKKIIKRLVRAYAGIT